MVRGGFKGPVARRAKGRLIRDLSRFAPRAPRAALLALPSRAMIRGGPQIRAPGAMRPSKNVARKNVAHEQFYYGASQESCSNSSNNAILLVDSGVGNCYLNVTVAMALPIRRH